MNLIEYKIVDYCVADLRVVCYLKCLYMVGICGNRVNIEFKQVKEGVGYQNSYLGLCVIYYFRIMAFDLFL